MAKAQKISRLQDMRFRMLRQELALKLRILKPRKHNQICKLKHKQLKVHQKVLPSYRDLNLSVSQKLKMKKQKKGEKLKIKNIKSF